jgi:DNA-binding protein HU-beta
LARAGETADEEARALSRRAHPATFGPRDNIAPGVGQEEETQMRKPELITKVATSASLTKAAAADAVDAVFACVAEAIKADGRLQVPGVGTFTVKKRAAKMGRNPRTGKPLKIPAKKVVTFKAAPKLKQGL